MSKTKVFESPLVNHVRMRALYRALVEVRGLGARVGRARVARGLEACWVAAAIDLRDGDLTSAGGGPALVDYIREVGLRATAGAASVGAVRRASGAGASGAGTGAFGGTATERMLCAVGSAMALKAAGQGAVCVAFAGENELTPAQWKRLLVVARDGDLPLVIVRVGGKTSLKIAGVPVIPVDAGDVLAIYRVTQECLVRARAEGGIAVIECVSSGLDPVKFFGQLLVTKGICTERWVAACERQFGVVASRA